MMNNIKGKIFDIQRFCIHDGPGIRTTVFFKGCPLRCIWCHNPESISMQKELIYRSHKCIGCRMCEKVCNYGVHHFDEGYHVVDYEKCTKCGRCIEICCYEAVSLVGREMSVREVMDSIKIDIPYYSNDGGVTLSGGEPMFQPQFALALAEAIKKEGINLCIETCGLAPAEQFIKIAPYVDLFLYDYKATSESIHKELTGASNKLILENLDLINSMDKKIILRCPLIPGINDSKDHLKGIADTARKYRNICKVEILPYHRMGETKRIQIGKAESLPHINQPSKEQKFEWLRQLEDYGCKAEIC